MPSPGCMLALTLIGAKSVNLRFSEGFLGKKYFSRADLFSPASSLPDTFTNPAFS